MGMNENHVFVPKGWGWEEWIANSPLYCGKRLFVWKGKKCSWHYHKLKDETFYVAAGEIILRTVRPHIIQFWQDKGWDLAAMIRNDTQAVDTHLLQPNDKFHVPVGMAHRFEGRLESTVFEFSTEHFDSDSYRITPGD